MGLYEVPGLGPDENREVHGPEVGGELPVSRLDVELPVLPDQEDPVPVLDHGAWSRRMASAMSPLVSARVLRTFSSGAFVCSMTSRTSSSEITGPFASNRGSPVIWKVFTPCMVMATTSAASKTYSPFAVEMTTRSTPSRGSMDMPILSIICFIFRGFTLPGNIGSPCPAVPLPLDRN